MDSDDFQVKKKRSLSLSGDSQAKTKGSPISFLLDKKKKIGSFSSSGKKVIKGKQRKISQFIVRERRPVPHTLPSFEAAKESDGANDPSPSDQGRGDVDRGLPLEVDGTSTVDKVTVEVPPGNVVQSVEADTCVVGAGPDQPVVATDDLSLAVEIFSDASNDAEGKIEGDGVVIAVASLPFGFWDENQMFLYSTILHPNGAEISADVALQDGALELDGPDASARVGPDGLDSPHASARDGPDGHDGPDASPAQPGSPVLQPRRGFGIKTNRTHIVLTDESSSDEGRDDDPTCPSPAQPGTSGLQKRGGSGIKTNRVDEDGSTEENYDGPMGEYLAMLKAEQKMLEEKERKRLRKRPAPRSQETEDDPQAPPSKKRRPRTPEEEGRKSVRCEYCKKEFYAQMPRHLLTVHKDVVKSPAQARALYNGMKEKQLKKSGPTMQELKEIWGEELEDAAVLENLKKSYLISGVAWPSEDADVASTSAAPVGEGEGSEGNDSSDSDSEDEEEEVDDATVRKRKKDRRLNLHVAKDHIVLQEFKAALKKVSSSQDSIKMSIERLSPFLAFAEYHDAASKGYWALVSVEAARRYMALNKQAGITNAAKVTYGKTMSKVLELKSRKGKMPTVPWSTKGFETNYDAAVTLWGDIRRKAGRRAVRDKNDKLAKGQEVIADLSAIFEYVDCPDIRQKFRGHMERLKSFIKFRTPLRLLRGDVAEVMSYNFVVRFLMMRLIVKNGGPRTGVLQNLRIPELEAATENGNKMIVRVKNHKTGMHGNATLVLTLEEHRDVLDYLAIRRRITCADKENRLRVFVTSGGLPFRNVHYDINVWLKSKNLPKINTNSIRKAVETSAGNHSVEVQKIIAKRLHHSVSTADANYRATTTDAVINQFEEVQNVANNERALKYLRGNMDRLLGDVLEFPTIEDLSEVLAREMRIANLRLLRMVCTGARVVRLKSGGRPELKIRSNLFQRFS